jgi:hypothetical protein
MVVLLFIAIPSDVGPHDGRPDEDFVPSTDVPLIYDA